MALPSRPLGITLLRAAEPKLVLDFYMDMKCPFSGRVTQTLFNDVFPLIDRKYPEKVRVRAFLVPQPWHPQSPMLTEAVLAMERTDPAHTVEFMRSIFQRVDRFSDERTLNMSRQQVYEEAASLAVEHGVDREAFLSQLRLLPDGSGTPVTRRLKHYVKHHRQFSIHVTPTAVVNGVVDPGVSSGWGAEEWDGYLRDRLEEE